MTCVMWVEFSAMWTELFGRSNVPTLLPEGDYYTPPKLTKQEAAKSAFKREFHNYAYSYTREFHTHCPIHIDHKSVRKL